jgi:hypothetical protein
LTTLESLPTDDKSQLAKHKTGRNSETHTTEKERKRKEIRNSETHAKTVEREIEREVENQVLGDGGDGGEFRTSFASD